MPGFGPNDPMTERAIGYRSSLMQSGVKSYNGYHFPPCLRSQITVVPEYDDSGRTTKYLTIAISLEFIMTDSAVTAEGTAALSRTQKDAGIHLEVNSLLKRLNQPCQELIFTANGFGDFIVNSTGGVQDVDFGPKPQVTEYEMLGGSQAAKVVWLCVTRVPPCLRESTGELIQFNYSTSWGIDNAGFMARTIEGMAEIPLTRNAQQGTQHASSIVEFPAYKLNQIKNKIISAWPRQPGFRRQISYRIKENRKQIAFKIEDIEIRSNSPFLPGISDIELTQNMSSSLEDGGFNQWKLMYSGTIEVVNAKTKGGISEAKKVAWIWLGKILEEKRKVFEQTIQANLINKKQPVPIVPGGNVPQVGPATMLANEYAWSQSMEADGYNGGAIIYPVHISITDSIYSNVIQFTFGYIARATSDLLGKAVGLFEPVKLQGLTDDQWVKFIATSKSDESATPVYEEREMIVDLCHSLTAPKGEVEKAHSVFEKANSSLMAVSAPETGKDWIDYKCTIRFIQDHQNIASTKLHADTTATQDSYTPEQMKHINKEMQNFPFTGTFYIPSSETGPAAQEARIETKVYSPNPALCYVEMRGWACRFNNQINPPNLIGVGQGISVDPNTGKGIIVKPELGGSLAHQYGTDDIRRSVQKTGLRDKNGNEVHKYYCSWKRKYILDRKPASGQALTTGLPHRFNNELKVNNG